MKVLIAEDKITSRLVLEEWLADWGYEVVSAPDGQTAWKMLQQDDEPPRMALLDWMMPNMDGVELCQHIKQSESLPFIYSVLLTSKSSKEDIVTGLDAGADDYLSKPVQPEELRSRLNVGLRIIDYQQRLLELDEQK
ncbi:MAG: response regulator, partial [Pseudomonadota bacterium]